MKTKQLFLVTVFFLCVFSVSAGNITFSGGRTKVNLQEGNHIVSLSQGANVNADDVSISAETIELSGDNYRMVKCTNDVNIIVESSNITMNCKQLTYDRQTEELLSDGWIEIDDNKNEVKLSAAWLDYDKKNSLMMIQVKATILKDTSNGLMKCTADSIEYNSELQTVTLKGSAKVVWGDDTYKASIIMVNLDTEEVSLHGSISGEVNG